VKKIIWNGIDSY